VTERLWWTPGFQPGSAHYTSLDVLQSITLLILKFSQVSAKAIKDMQSLTINLQLLKKFC